MTHEERLALINRPFFITYMAPSYPWGGCAVTDNFYNTHGWAERSRPFGGDKTLAPPDVLITLFQAGDITKFNYISTEID